MARTWHRWLPAGAAVALVAGTATITSQAGAVDLPDKSPEEVLALLAEHDVEAFSGTFETSAELGLPVPADIDLGPGGPELDGVEVPGSAAATTEVLAALELLTGDNTVRVFTAGPGTARIQHLDGMDERNLVVTPEDVWAYDSATDEALHVVLPSEAELRELVEQHVMADLPEGAELDDPAALRELMERHGMTEVPDMAELHGMLDSTVPLGPLPTPEELAAAAVTALEPSTELVVGQDERVAGRDAYTLSLVPRAPETLVEAVTIAVDGETGFPLGVTVTARGQEAPALQAEYTAIDFSTPDASLFEFSPPAGAVVEEEVGELPDPAALPDLSELEHRLQQHDTDAPATAPEGDVVGEGWASVAVLPLGDSAPLDDPMVAELTERVPGGRLLSTSLVSVLLTDDGRLLAGAVTPEHLADVAGE